MSNHLKITDNSGRCPKWLSPEALQVDIDRYFEYLGEVKPPFFEGFCVFVGIDKSSFSDTYLKNPVFSPTCKRLLDRIDAKIMEMTALGTIKTPMGIFYLKTRGYIEAGNDNKDSNNKPITINLIEAPKKESNE